MEPFVEVLLLAGAACWCCRASKGLLRWVFFFFLQGRCVYSRTMVLLVDAALAMQRALSAASRCALRARQIDEVARPETNGGALVSELRAASCDRKVEPTRARWTSTVVLVPAVRAVCGGL